MSAVRILGLDPGLNRTGWGIIECEGNRLRHVGHGVVTSQAGDPLAVRLADIHKALMRVVAEWLPEEAAVEEVFVNRNPSSTLKLGMARGIALLVPAMAGMRVAEYAANLVKKSVVGTGHADKSQVAMMVGRLLPGARAQADAADALAVAICHAHHRSSPASSPRPSGERVPAKPAGEGAFRPKPDSTQIERARELRRDSTDVEQVLWRHLRNEQTGVKFRRQVPILGFVADFLSHDAKLVIELDGGQHADQTDADARRTKMLEQAGFRVLRFWNNEVNESLEGVLQTIVGALPPHPPADAGPSLSPAGRGDFHPRPSGERVPAKPAGEGAASLRAGGGK